MAGLKTFEKVPIDTNIAAGNEIPINLPVGKTYETIALKLTDLAKTDLEDIRIRINDNIISQYRNVDHLEKIQSYYGYSIEADTVFIHFLAREFDQIKHQNSFTLGTVGVNTATVTLKIKDNAAGANPSIKAYAVKSVGVAPGTLAKVRAFPISVPAGVYEFADIPRPDGARIKAIHVIKPEDDINHVELEVNKRLYVETSKDALQSFQKMYKRAPQAGMYTLEFGLQGDVYELFKIPPKMIATQTGAVPNPDQITDMRLRMDCTAAGQVYVIVEYMDAWNPNGF